MTDCQRQGLRCSEKGDFLPAQLDILSGRWRCFSSEGVELDWTNSDKVLSDDECSGKSSFPDQRELVEILTVGNVEQMTISDHSQHHSLI